jgi:hypothetical protein
MPVRVQTDEALTGLEGQVNQHEGMATGLTARKSNFIGGDNDLVPRDWTLAKIHL